MDLKKKIFIEVRDKLLDSYHSSEFECHFWSLSDYLEYSLVDYFNSDRYEIKVLILDLNSDYKSISNKEEI